MIGTRKGLTHGRETWHMNIGCSTCLRYRLLIHVWRLSSMSESLSCPYHYSRWSFQREFRSARVTTLYTIHLHIHTYMYPYIHTYMHAYIHTYIHTNLHTNIHTYIQTNIHTYIHTHIHTYIHTYNRSAYGISDVQLSHLFPPFFVYDYLGGASRRNSDQPTSLYPTTRQYFGGAGKF